MFMKATPTDWGKGIPDYNESDLMSREELYDFALDVVASYETKQGAILKDASPNPDSIPSLVMEINGSLAFVLVEVAVAPQIPVLQPRRKKILMMHSKKFGADCYYASVAFGAADHIRFEKSIALRGDAFYARYLGLDMIDGITQ